MCSVLKENIFTRDVCMHPSLRFPLCESAYSKGAHWKQWVIEDSDAAVAIMTAVAEGPL